MRPFAKLLWTIAILNKNSNLRGELAVASSVMLRMFVKMVQVHNDGLFLESTRPSFCFFACICRNFTRVSTLNLRPNTAKRMCNVFENNIVRMPELCATV